MCVCVCVYIYIYIYIYLYLSISVKNCDYFQFLYKNSCINFCFVCFEGFTTSELDLSSPLNYGTPTTPRTPGIGSTPIRHRPDIRSDRKMKQVDLGGSEGHVSFP